jgi:thioredoxin 1
MIRSWAHILRHAIPVIILITLCGTACTSVPAPVQQSTTIVRSTAISNPATPYPVEPTSFPSQSSKPIFVEFYTTWCAPCKQMEPIVYKLADEYGNRVDFKILDAAGASAEKKKYQYVSQPQVVLVNKSGAIVDTLYGFQGYDGLKKALDTMLKTP